MSEPDAGSDLASVRTTATRTEDGWRVDGTKVWTTNAHLNHFFVVLCRTSAAEDRHAGLSQLIVDLSSPGVSVSPIPLIDGELHVNEVVLDGVHVPDERVLGEVGQGWAQVTAELAHERSGPDRYLSVLGLLRAFLAERGPDLEDHTAAAFGAVAARLWTIRQLSLAVARSLEQGEAPATEAALVKDVGTVFEQEVVETMRELAGTEIDPEASSLFERLLAECVLNAPSWTLRGGTTEVLRGIAGKALTRDGSAR
ncbi:MAG TPA: acyl-CoA dehydrogenase family protein [Actinomycetospora sp.]|jgi:alkylation response protein AidB-like acyl-CoA dehydrogenase|uniref:acyl-CoA dehydrogenase family protein n=1 Tax=Actinomycetospora sp. TaxID=1872135 RepID=UPI002F3F410C